MVAWRFNSVLSLFMTANLIGVAFVPTYMLAFWTKTTSLSVTVALIIGHFSIPIIGWILTNSFSGNIYFLTTQCMNVLNTLMLFKIYFLVNLSLLIPLEGLLWFQVPYSLFHFKTMVTFILVPLISLVSVIYVKGSFNIIFLELEFVNYRKSRSLLLGPVC
jgi:hypothetical protein